MKKTTSPAAHHSLGEAMNELQRRSQRKYFRPIKTLRELFPDIIAARDNLELTPQELCKDSRRVTPGAVFFATPGERTDGHTFIPEAISRGAIAIVSERPLPAELPVATLQVPSLPHALADAARRFWGLPDKKLTLVGITGTKGKTTTTYMVRHLMRKAGLECGMLSTIENDWGNRAMPATRTTADAVDIAMMMAQMVENGCTHAGMEVSSHALAQGRVLGIGYEVAAFTNLNAEHMDYHGTMENYFQAKKKLFDGSMGHRPKVAVINLDDPYGQRLLGEIHERVETISWGTLPGCDLRIEDAQTTPQGSRCTLRLGYRKYPLELPMLGKHNLMNAAGALAVAWALGMNVKEAAGALSQMPQVPGRLEKIDEGQGFDVRVDYAHTDESLRSTLETLRQVHKGRLIAVIGCGGNRDQSKRARMTRVAMTLADQTIATADNPRRENLADIFAMMKQGVVHGRPIQWTADRREAITQALQAARPGDCVLIAGKGHETYQEFADAIVPFDDRIVAKEALREMGYGKA